MKIAFLYLGPLLVFEGWVGFYSTCMKWGLSVVEGGSGRLGLCLKTPDHCTIGAKKRAEGVEEQYEDMVQMMLLLTHLVSRDFIDFDENGMCSATGENRSGARIERFL